jgi:POT family proton-dependent oligopeptide transporter
MVKFGLGIFQLGLGFLVFALSARFMDDAGTVSMLFLLVGYLFITSGELFLSPIGLSKVTELSPAKLVSFMIGVWFLSSSFAHYIAGIIAKLTSDSGGAVADETLAETASEPGFMSSIATMITGGVPDGRSSASVESLINYTGVFAQIAVISFAFAGIAILISPIIKRMMHGIR